MCSVQFLLLEHHWVCAHYQMVTLSRSDLFSPLMQIELNDLGPITKLGMGRRTGDEVPELPPLRMLSSVTTAVTSAAEGSSDEGRTEEAASTNGSNGQEPGAGPNASALTGSQLLMRTRCKRKRAEKTSQPLVVAAQANTEEG